MNSVDISEEIGAHIANSDIQEGERLTVLINGTYVAAVNVMKPDERELVTFELID